MAPPPILVLSKKIYTAYLTLNGDELYGAHSPDSLIISLATLTTDHPTFTGSDFALILEVSGDTGYNVVKLTMPTVQYEVLTVSAHSVDTFIPSFGIYKLNIVHECNIFKVDGDINTIGNIKVYFNYTLNNLVET